MSTTQVEVAVSLLGALDLNENGDSIVGNVEEALLEAKRALDLFPDLQNERSRLRMIRGGLDSWQGTLDNIRATEQPLAGPRRQRILAIQALTRMGNAAAAIANAQNTRASNGIQTSSLDVNFMELQQAFATLLNLFPETRPPGASSPSLAPAWANSDDVRATASAATAIARRDSGVAESNSTEDGPAPSSVRPRSTPYSFSGPSSSQYETRPSNGTDDPNAVPRKQYTFKFMHITGRTDTHNGGRFETAEDAAADNTHMVFDKMIIDGDARVLNGIAVGKGDVFGSRHARQG